MRSFAKVSNEFILRIISNDGALFLPFSQKVYDFHTVLCMIFIQSDVGGVKIHCGFEDTM